MGVVLGGAHRPESGADVEHAGHAGRDGGEEVNALGGEEEAAHREHHEGEIDQVQEALDRHLGNRASAQPHGEDAVALDHPPELPAHHPREEHDARDLDAAIALLASTPYADGFDLTLQTWGFRPGWLDATLIIKDNLADLGINVEVESLEDSVAVNNLITANFVAQWTGGGGFPPIVAYGNQFTALYSDWCSYQNDEIVDLLTQATSEIDQDRRISLLHQIEELFYEDLPYIPIVERVELTGSRLPGAFYGMAPFGQYPFAMTLAEAQAELAGQ